MTFAITAKDARLTQAERTDISDKKMFDTAVELINQHGPAATSLSDVGVLAGYSRGLASNRFGCKDNLFNFVVLRVGEIWLEQLKNATGNQTGFAAIEKAVDQHYQFCVDAPAHLRAFYTLWFESVNAKSELSGTIQKIHQRRFQDVVNWVLNDLESSEAHKRDAELIASQFSASVIGIVYYWLANPENIKETKRLHDGLKQTMMHLLK
ncbi:MAG: AcrR family transcriptional regulator [Arenicella sp.]|jgi:AcrR family transcriptional regulator